jgi:hypothetical protein
MDFGVEPDANSLETYNTLAEQFNKDAQKYDTSISPGNPAKGTLGELIAIDSNDLDLTANAPGGVIGKVPFSGQSSEAILAEKISDESYKQGIKEHGTKFPTQFYERYIQPGNEGMFEVGAGSEFNTVITNAKTGSSEMIRAEIDIIGDPYWLDKPEFSAPFSDKQAVNFKRENVIFFTSRYPSESLKDAVNGGIGSTSDLKMNTDQFLTAMYRVVRVDNTFDNGQFTTKLSVVRDSITDLGLVLQDPNLEYVADEMMADANDGFIETNDDQSMKKKVEKIDTNKDNLLEEMSEGSIEKLPVPNITIEFVGNKNKGLNEKDANFDTTNVLGDNVTNNKLLKKSEVSDKIGKKDSFENLPDPRNQLLLSEKKLYDTISPNAPGGTE